jgi:hypothetical protein
MLTALSMSQETVPTHVPPWKSQMTVMIRTAQTASRSQKRQNQARRRLTTSSSRRFTLSEPKRLGHGIVRLKSRSTLPRKAMTHRNVATSDHRSDQPWSRWNHTKSAGLVSTATNVAARLSRRHWSARSFEDSLVASAVRGSAAAAIPTG